MAAAAPEVHKAHACVLAHCQASSLAFGHGLPSRFSFKWCTNQNKGQNEASNVWGPIGSGWNSDPRQRRRRPGEQLSSTRAASFHSFKPMLHSLKNTSVSGAAVEPGWCAKDEPGRQPDLQQHGEGSSTSPHTAAMLGPASSGSAAPPQRSAHQLPLHMRLMRRGEQAVTLFSLLLQLALYSRSVFSLTARQHLHQLVLLLLRAVCLAAATLLPTKAWLRWRVPLIAGLRLAIVLVPSQRSARVRLGGLSQCMQGPACWFVGQLGHSVALGFTAVQAHAF